MFDVFFALASVMAAPCLRAVRSLPPPPDAERRVRAGACGARRRCEAARRTAARFCRGLRRAVSRTTAKTVLGGSGR